jgi:hypothetical protein
MQLTRPRSLSAGARCVPAARIKASPARLLRHLAVLALLLPFSAPEPAAAAPRLKDISYSAAFVYEICTGQRRDASRQEQESLCWVYLSSFVETTDEYSQAGFKLFCAPDALPLEALRRVFLTYTAELPDAAEYLPGGRVMVQALMRAYPCAARP